MLAADAGSRQPGFQFLQRPGLGKIGLAIGVVPRALIGNHQLAELPLAMFAIDRITSYNVCYTKLLRVTFTNKAAAEMRERVGDLLGDNKKANQLTMGTFHVITSYSIHYTKLYEC